MHCTSLVILQSRQISCINSVVIYVCSHHFIANSTSYLHAAGFSANFFQFLKDWGWAGGKGMGEGRGGWGVEGNHLDSNNSAVSFSI